MKEIRTSTKDLFHVRNAKNSRASSKSRSYNINRNPYEGIGKPEPLKYKLQGFWSRRIDSEHRLVYRICNNQLEIAHCRNHYND